MAGDIECTVERSSELLFAYKSGHNVAECTAALAAAGHIAAHIGNAASVQLRYAMLQTKQHHSHFTFFSSDCYAMPTQT